MPFCPATVMKTRVFVVARNIPKLVYVCMSV